MRSEGMTKLRDFTKGGDMNVSALALGIASTASIFGGPDLSDEALAVRSVSDASACRLIESSYLESRPQFIQDYVKRNVANVGGNAFKIINVSQTAAVGIPISQVTYEAYDCKDMRSKAERTDPDDTAAAGNETSNKAAVLSDKQWGEVRCDLVSQENRDPCMAAHARLDIASDRTTATSCSSVSPE